VTSSSKTDAFTFDPACLGQPREGGISAFMRVRNGEDFIALAIESHLPWFDEIVVCHNRCTDGTVGILERLQTRHPDKLRIFEYVPRVHPAGSRQHRREHWRSVNSLANFYNFSLAKTRYRVAIKLDDDHVAIPEGVGQLTRTIREADHRLGKRMLCFSGINLVLRDAALGPLAYRPFAGHGDHWYFEVSPDTYFVQDRRFERFTRRGMQREYHGLAYWHLKYLKQGEGFSNYELDNNPDSRYGKQYLAYREGLRHIDFDELDRLGKERIRKGQGLFDKLRRRLDDKHRLKFERARQFDPGVARQWLEDASPALKAHLQTLPWRTDASADG